MTARTLALSLALSFATAVSLAQAPQMGTWKLNEAQSKIAPNATRITTVVYAPAGDSVKITTDGTDPKGQPLHTEWTGKFDGKDYPLTGSSTADVRAYTRVNDRTLTVSDKRAGKQVTSGQIKVAPDGKSRTVSLTATDASGQKVVTTTIYNKE